jgi:hypothetical protein
VRRDPPALVVTLPLEGIGRIVFVAASYEDELRLRRWLRTSDEFAALPSILERLLDDMDEHDDEDAA